MLYDNEGSGLPSAAEMAVCLRDPSRKSDLRQRIEDHYLNLRQEVARPQKDEPLLIKKYSQIMSRLRIEEEILLNMLESFSRGDADSIRKASAKLAREGLKKS